MLHLCQYSYIIFNMIIASRLEEFIKSEGISARAVDQVCGFTHGFTSRTIKQGSAIRTDKLARLKECFPNVNVNWLVGAEDSMYISDQQQEVEKLRRLLKKAEEDLQWHKNHTESLLSAFRKDKKS